MSKQLKFSTIVLAAGSSQRLGTEKQLLPFKNSFLLKYIMDECHKIENNKSYAILGFQAEKIQSMLGPEYNTLVNPNHLSGMGTSIAFALSQLKLSKEDALIVVLCDQIYFTEGHLRKLINKIQNSSSPIIASSYSETLGVPAIFTHKYFSELIKLDGDNGAKKIILQNLHDVDYVQFTGGEIDLDQPNDILNIL